MGFQKGIFQEWLSVLSWNFKEMMRGMISWPKRQYLQATNTTTNDRTTTATTTNATILSASVATTIKDEDTEVKIGGNVEGKVELN